MAQSNTNSVYVGLDVHKASIDIALAEAGREGEVRHLGSIGGDLAALDRALRKLISRGQPLHVVYEAGPCGFVIWQHISALGAYYRRLCTRMVKPKAVTAAAHKLARLIYAMLSPDTRRRDGGLCLAKG